MQNLIHTEGEKFLFPFSFNNNKLAVTVVKELEFRFLYLSTPKLKISTPGVLINEVVNYLIFNFFPGLL